MRGMTVETKTIEALEDFMADCYEVPDNVSVSGSNMGGNEDPISQSQVEASDDSSVQTNASGGSRPGSATSLESSSAVETAAQQQQPPVTNITVDLRGARGRTSQDSEGLVELVVALSKRAYVGKLGVAFALVDLEGLRCGRLKGRLDLRAGAEEVQELQLGTNTQQNESTATSAAAGSGSSSAVVAPSSYGWGAGTQNPQDLRMLAKVLFPFTFFASTPHMGRRGFPVLVAVRLLGPSWVPLAGFGAERTVRTLKHRVGLVQKMRRLWTPTSSKEQPTSSKELESSFEDPEEVRLREVATKLLVAFNNWLEKVCHHWLRTLLLSISRFVSLRVFSYPCLLSLLTFSFFFPFSFDFWNGLLDATPCFPTKSKLRLLDLFRSTAINSADDAGGGGANAGGGGLSVAAQLAAAKAAEADAETLDEEEVGVLFKSTGLPGITAEHVRHTNTRSHIHFT